MKVQIRFALRAAALAGLAMAAAAAGAQTETVNPFISFNEFQAGSVINNLYAPQYLVTFTGTSSNPNNNGVQILDIFSPSSSQNYLDATTSPGVLVQFDRSKYYNGVDSFDIHLEADPAGFGSPSAALVFYGSDGQTLGALPVDATSSHDLHFAQAGIQSVLLSPDAYYSNLSWSAVVATPEPGLFPQAITFLGLGVGGWALARRRRN